MIRPTTLADARSRPELDEIIREYAAECATAGLPAFCPDFDMYEAMEQAGIMRVIVVEKDAQLVGFATLLLTRLSHYSATIGMTESIFIAPAHRAGGAGLRLVRFLEDTAKESGAVGFFLTAPVGGQLNGVLERTSTYQHTNNMFFKALT